MIAVLANDVRRWANETEVGLAVCYVVGYKEYGILG